MSLLGSFLGGLGGSIGGAVGGIASTLASMRNTDKTNQTNKNVADQNLAFQREQQEYQKQLQQLIFEREDTAHQREIQDLRAAGINPLATAGGNGANAGSVVPLTEMNNNYQAQTTDFSGLQAAGQAIDTAIQNERALEDARQAREDTKTENMYARTQQHAEFTQELALRESEANVNMMKALADIAAHTEDNRLKEKLENQANDLARKALYQQIREYNENATYRNEQERQLKIQNDRAQHDYNIDKKAGTKSQETQNEKITSAARIITSLTGKESTSANTNIQKNLTQLKNDDALTIKILAEQLKSQLPNNYKEYQTNATTQKIKKFWESKAKELKRAKRSDSLINTIKSLELYGAVPEYE